ncbi:cupin domain-containing protein [Gordonia lacunae]|uniref:ChrR-like cupin domain-containing protein n=1 Tax=Gordonia lacunae TaxID=417102 RepID=A0A243QDC6_9ACTN|nr:hypothetical protein [Gordonia lacunae]OUC79335.1 hypothetical protein CA982_07655 [Gordonia lacunae]
MDTSSVSTAGWDINPDGTADWVPWGEGDLARAKVLASGDDYMLVLVEARAGYRGSPHEHTSTEFSHVLSGRLRNQGIEMTSGGAYVAAIGSRHDDFEALEDATYLSVFRI